jgi:hypothetical protein
MSDSVAIIRWTLTAILLYFGVWKHSHWTVALSLTLIFLTLEGFVILLRRRK